MNLLGQEFNDLKVIEKTKQTQKHDKIKNNWCKENNIPIIRIPYTKLHNIQIEDLLLDTSNYII